jgi:hypothetical protein
MKLGISRPRKQEYRPRPIDAKASKDARTKHAKGAARMHAAFGWGKPSGIPAPGRRGPAKIDPEEAREHRRKIGNWTGVTFGKLTRTVKGRKRRERKHDRVEKLRIRHGVRLDKVEARARRYDRQMPTVTADERRRRRKAARKARKANRR